MFELPIEVQKHIYEYDSTYHEHYKVAMLELIELTLLIKYIRVCAYDIIISEKERKKILRNIKKDQLRRLAYFTKTPLPKKSTKRKLLLKILFNTYFYTRSPRVIFKQL